MVGKLQNFNFENFQKHKFNYGIAMSKAFAGGSQSILVQMDDLSSSSFSSNSRASLDAASSSPTASYTGENHLLHFHGDSSGSL
ncbi:hypothetical protein DMENIID0001_013810 [Sergentomyia squamirostris]